MLQELIRYENVFAKMLTKLYTANVLTLSDLTATLKDVCSMCRKMDHVRKFLHLLELVGVNVLPDIMIHKLKFMTIFIVIKLKKIRRCQNISTIATSTPYVKFIGLAYPRSIILSLFVPENVNIYEVLGEYPEGIIQIHRYAIRSKPIPEYLFMLLKGLEDVFNKKSFSICMENALNLPEDWVKRARISSLALNILDILSLDPKLTLDEVRDEIKKRFNKEFNMTRIKKYVRYATRFMYGYRVSIVGAPYVSNVKLCLIVKGVSDVNRFCSSIVRHPLTLVCSWNDEGDVTVCFSLPEKGKYLTMFKENLYYFVDLFKGEVIEEAEYIIDEGYTAAVNIPHGEWSPFLRSWRKFKNVVPSIIDKLRQGGCVEV